MNNLTFLDNGKPAFRINGVVYKHEVSRKLHAYEATGLSPEEISAMIAENGSLKAFKEYFDDMYGKGLEVANFHLNGEFEPFDNFYERACSCYNEKEESVTSPSDSETQGHVHCKDCDYLCEIGGKICCCYPRMISNGLEDWCRHGKKRGENNDA